MHHAADKIRNVALVGHRGSGKTSLFEALLYEAGVTTRLGSVADGTSLSDTDPDEQARAMSISLALSSFTWQDRKINLLDTPGEPSFVADALGALRVCESAVFVVNAVMGVEVSTSRLWARAAELDIARSVFVNMLDRERADFFRTLDSLKAAFGPHVVAVEIPIGTEQEVRGVVDLVDMKAYEYPSAERGAAREIPIPEDLQLVAEEYREKLMDEVSEVSESLMERYLADEEISHDEIVAALKDGTNHGSLFPVACGVATANLGTNRLLDAIVEDLPSPVKHGGPRAARDHLRPGRRERRHVRLRLQDAGRPVRRAHQPVPRLPGRHEPRHPRAEHPHARQGAHRPAAELRGQGARRTPTSSGPGDIGAVAKLKETRAGDWLAARDEPISMPSIKLPAPVMAFAMEAKGDEDKVYTALRRLQEEDPTIDLHRDPQTGEQIVAGLSQIHVEVIVDRLKSRFGAEVELKPPRVPYMETIRKPARAHGRHKKQTGGRGQFGDCHIEIEPLDGDDFEFVDKIKGGVIPHGLHPRCREGRARRDGPRRRGRLPGQGRAGPARRRQLPHGRLVRAGLPHGGVDRDEGGAGQRGRGAARADHARHAVGARGRRSATSSATSTRAAGGRRAWSPRAR